MKNLNIFNLIKKGLIVSCQALEDEPLFDPYIMARMAYAAKLGGAVAIRANSPEQIRKIKEAVDLPIIGLYKKTYIDSNVFITPTEAEVDELYECGVDIIALDATNRLRPTGQRLNEFFVRIKANYPETIFMADCSNYDEAIYAEGLGFDCVATTLAGYTEYTKDIELPDFNMIEKLKKDVSVPIISEGGIWNPEQLSQAFLSGAWSVVVGSAITRPMEITKRFVDAIKQL